MFKMKIKLPLSVGNIILTLLFWRCYRLCIVLLRGIWLLIKILFQLGSNSEIKCIFYQTKMIEFRNMSRTYGLPKRNHPYNLYYNYLLNGFSLWITVPSSKIKTTSSLKAPLQKLKRLHISPIRIWDYETNLFWIEKYKPFVIV